MSLRIISKKDEEIEHFREQIVKFVQTYEAMGLEYWLFVCETNPVAIFYYGKEPVNLISPIGTPICMIQIIDYEKTQACIDEIAKNAFKRGKSLNPKYIFVPSIPSEHKKISRAFNEQGFEEKATWYRMDRLLDKIPDPQEQLKFEKVEQDKVREFLKASDTSTSGSYEGESVVNLAGVPDMLLNLWSNMQELYFAYLGSERIGILNLTPGSQSNLNNIGVEPDFRSKGYGKLILRFALERLKELGKERAGLRVHVKNVRATELYTSFGFNIIDKQIDLIYWNPDF
jgi:ribosomal protein S18 acetylase RimI-like enzyme